MIESIRNDLKSGLSIEKVCNKYNLTLSQLFNTLNGDKTNKPRKNKSVGDMYISFQANRWKITKTIRGCTKYFGSYFSKDDAKLIRDELIKCNWDTSQLEKICYENNVKQVPKNVILSDNAYIYKYNDSYYICKIVNGKYIYYGYYEDLHDARKVRDELIKVNFDKSKLKQIQRKVKVKECQSCPIK